VNEPKGNLLLDRGLLMSLLLERQKDNSGITEAVEAVANGYSRIIYEAPGASALEHFLDNVNAFKGKLVAISNEFPLEVNSQEAELLRKTIRAASQRLRIVHAFQIFATDVGAVGRNLEDTIAYMIRLLLIARQSVADVFVWPQRWKVLLALFEEADISLTCAQSDQRWQVYQAEGFPYLVSEDGPIDRATRRMIVIDREFLSAKRKEEATVVQNVPDTLPAEAAQDVSAIAVTNNRATAARDAGQKTRKKKHVFISYCRDNLQDVAEIRKYLSDQGENTWWDQDILPGQDWKFEIRRAMKDSYAVLLCLSKESEARSQSGIYPEVLDAINVYREYAPGNVFIIPVRLSECEIPPIEIDSSRLLDRLQCVDLFPPKKRIEGLKRALAALKTTPGRPLV
jgi:hypothetical protein